MVKSMTGFGSGKAQLFNEAGEEVKSVLVEIKTVNSRYLEVVTKMPKFALSLEDLVKKTVSNYLNRGRVEVFITFSEKISENSDVLLDETLAMAYYNSLRRLATLCNLPLDSISVEKIASFPQVLTLEQKEENMEIFAELLEEALKDGLVQLVEMRETEGNKLREDLLQRKDIIANILMKIEDRAPLVVTDYQKRLNEHIKELVGENVVLSEDRIATEVALFADKASITEEIVRLHSHLAQMEDMLNSSEPVGRKLDFLVQEMNRETNTIGSKANDLELSHLVIDSKAEIEKIREQIQNIE